MPDLPTSTAALTVFVFLLGLRHGLDADHLAAVDALTRLHHQAGRPGARACGLRFALGHGGVVMAVALASALARERWSVPPWLDLFGAWCSIGMLLALGLVNLAALRQAPAGCAPAIAGLRTVRALRDGALTGAAGLGALFALSFDTLALAALFGVAGAAGGGAAAALGLAALFATGMALVDGLDGLWVAKLLRGHGARSAAAARALGWAVTLLSLTVAAWGIWRLAGAPGAEDTLWPGLAAVAVVAWVWLATRRRAGAASDAASIA